MPLRRRRDEDPPPVQLTLFADPHAIHSQKRVRVPEQLSLVPPLSAEARQEQFEKLLAEEAWARFRRDLGAWLFFGEPEMAAAAMRRGHFARARAIHKYERLKS